VLGTLGAIALKFAIIAGAVIGVETVQSRLRFYRYQEPLAAAFVFAVLAMVANQIR